MAINRDIEDLKGLNKLLIPSKEEFTKSAKFGLFKAMKGVKDEIIRDHYWEDRSGSLTRSHYVRPRSGLRMEIGASAPHATFLENGTKAHFISPKGGSLSWTQGGSLFYSKGHMVSGIKGRPWLKETILKEMPASRKIIRDTIIKMWEKRI